MAYKISNDCISCGACEAECPVSAQSSACIPAPSSESAVSRGTPAITSSTG